MDTDQDKMGDACDPCPFDPNNDDDGDGVCADDGDCNDQDSTVYPDAPGTHEGKDNNCNGVIDKDEKKTTSHSPLYPNYMALSVPWPQSFLYSNLNYQLPLTASWSPIRFPIYQQQPSYAIYQPSVYSNRYIQNISQYGLLQSPFSQSNWAQVYIMPWNILINQIP